MRNHADSYYPFGVGLRTVEYILHSRSFFPLSSSCINHTYLLPPRSAASTSHIPTMQTPEQAAAEAVLMTRQHRYIQRELDNKNIFAPVELAGQKLSILDVGSGNGMLIY